MIFTFSPQTRRTNNPWEQSEDPLWLLSPEEFALLPDGTQLTCINGGQFVKGVDEIDQDTRFGLLAFGLLESQLLQTKESN